MKQYISEDRALYEDAWHGQFSRKLAEWAINTMKGKDDTPVKTKKLDEVMKILNDYGVALPDKYKYTAWYLFNMAIADYQHAIPTDEVKAYFVYETIMDPDGCPANTLDCFVTKMCNAGEPIIWEEML